MYCKKCNKVLAEDATFCPGCGEKVNKEKEKKTAAFMIGWIAFGILLPIFGLIFYVLWMDTYPERAKLVGKTSLIASVVYLIIIIIVIVSKAESAVSP